MNSYASSGGFSRRKFLGYSVGAAFIAAFGGSSVERFLIRAGEADAAKIATGWQISDELAHSVVVSGMVSAAGWLAHHGIHTLESAAETGIKVIYKQFGHGVSTPDKNIVFPVEPVGHPGYSNLVYIGTPDGHVIDFLPRAALALAASVRSLVNGTPRTRPMSVAEATQWLMPVTAATNVNGSHTFVEYASHRSLTVQIMHGVDAQGNSRERITIPEIPLTWIYATGGTRDVTLLSSTPLAVH